MLFLEYNSCYIYTNYCILSSHFLSFFNNLKTIKDRVDHMLSLDPEKVDKMLQNGHDWANDHIATSKDDVEEVYNWLTAEMR